MKVPPAFSPRRERVVGAALVLLVATALGWSWQAHDRAKRAQRHLLAAERSWQALARSEPVPTAENAALWTERRARAEDDLVEARRRLGAEARTGLSQEPAPTQRAEAFFALARFVETQRDRAAAAGVVVPPGCAFGFSAYANSGPADDELPLVHRQQQIAGVLLDLLWRSGARELTRVQREWPADKLAEAAPTGGAQPRRDGRPEDILPRPAQRSLARPGLVDTLTLRIGFIGKTVTLRWYLNELAALPLPLVVRAVEVEPLGADGSARGGLRTLADLFGETEVTEVAGAADAGAALPVPIIAANDAEFLLTIDCLEFAVAAEGQEVAP